MEFGSLHRTSSETGVYYYITTRGCFVEFLVSDPLSFLLCHVTYYSLTEESNPFDIVKFLDLFIMLFLKRDREH